MILFQGDSITDAGRDRRIAGTTNHTEGMGEGYAFIAACQLLADYPEKHFKFYNRGISGNKVFQLKERWHKDCLCLKPDVLSVLIGVNDFWHTLSHDYQGTRDVYERDYLALMYSTREALPKTRIIICEPFILPCGHIEIEWLSQFQGYREAARKVADSIDAVFVPFQSMFDEACQRMPAAYWATDGVHPTAAANHLMAGTWVKTVSGLFDL